MVWKTIRRLLGKPGDDAGGGRREIVPSGVILPFRRDAFVPRTEDGDAGPGDSKFSGIPHLEAGEDWPVCGRCGLPMQLFLQLDLATLPARPDGCPEGGLLQLFYCTNVGAECEVDGSGWEPFGETKLLRVHAASGDALEIGESPVPAAFPARRITGWDRRDDFPGIEEADRLGLDLIGSDDENGLILDGEKLLGWPFWAQLPEYPECPDCGSEMTYLFQVDSDGNLPWMFGDAGLAHVTFCPAHPARWAFGWACL